MRKLSYGLFFIHLMMFAAQEAVIPQTSDGDIIVIGEVRYERVATNSEMPILRAVGGGYDGKYFLEDKIVRKSGKPYTGCEKKEDAERMARREKKQKLEEIEKDDAKKIDDSLGKGPWVVHIKKDGSRSLVPQPHSSRVDPHKKEISSDIAVAGTSSLLQSNEKSQQELLAQDQLAAYCLASLSQRVPKTTE